MGFETIPREMEGFNLGSPIVEFLKKHKYVKVSEDEAKTYYFPKGLYWGQKIFILDDQPLFTVKKQITLTFDKEKLFSIAVTHLTPPSPWPDFIAGYISRYGQPENQEGNFFWEDEMTQMLIGKVEQLGITAFNIILYDKMAGQI